MCIVGMFAFVCVVHFHGVYLFNVINEILSETRAISVCVKLMKKSKSMKV